MDILKEDNSEFFTLFEKANAFATASRLALELQEQTLKEKEILEEADKVAKKHDKATGIVEASTEKATASKENYNALVAKAQEANENLSIANGAMFQAAKTLFGCLGMNAQSRFKSLSTKIDVGIANLILGGKGRKEEKAYNKADRALEKKQASLSSLSMSGEQFTKTLIDALKKQSKESGKNPITLEDMHKKSEGLLNIYDPIKQATQKIADELLGQQKQHKQEIKDLKNEKNTAQQMMDKYDNKILENEENIASAKEFVAYSNEKLGAATTNLKDAAKQLFASCGQNVSAGLKKKFEGVKNFFTQMKETHTINKANEEIAKQKNSATNLYREYKENRRDINTNKKRFDALQEQLDKDR